jgi:flavin-dependent dehydrogenase
VKHLRNAIEIYFVPRFQPGYAWVIPLDRHRANIGVGIRADACIGNHIRIRKELRRFLRLHPALSRRMEGARETGALCGWPIATYSRTRKTCASHVLLLGDAAGLVDPLSGEGVFGAMQSAWIAARVTEEALHREEFSCAFLRRYEERCRRFFDADFRSAALMTGLLAHRSLGTPLALWGLKRVEKTCNLDPRYARVVAGFFTGMQPRKRFFKARWIWKTLFG